jgi:hypothetical protein
MNRFGFTVIPSDDGGFYAHSVGGAERGVMPNHRSADDVIKDPDTLPAVVFYKSAWNRDVEMDAYAKRHPGVMLAPIEIRAAIKYQPANEATKFDISDKGVLPA